MSQKRFFPDLVSAIHKCSQCDPPLTLDFFNAVDIVLPVFDSLGGVMSLAKTEMLAKNESIKKSIPRFSNLKELVEADKKANTVTVKDSGARNLHRLRTVILFISQLFQNLIANADISLSSAAGAAYSATLAPYHSLIIRNTVSTGLMLLPSRTDFLASLGVVNIEAGDAGQYISAAAKLCGTIDQFYDVPMPPSTAWI